MKPTGYGHLSDQQLLELEIAQRNRQRQEGRALHRVRQEIKRRRLTKGEG